MAQFSYGYNGHTISVDVDADNSGVWYWQYKINGFHFSECHDTAYKSYELMLAEAKRAAETKANRLPPAE